MNRLIATAAIALGLTALTAGTAAAQTYQAPPPPAPRGGFTIGFGAGVGNIACSSVDGVCDGTEEAVGLSLHLGGLINPRLAILVDIWPMIHAEDNVTLSQTFTTVGVRWWLLPRLWLHGGIGGAQARASFSGVIGGIDVGAETETEVVGGVVGAVGYDLVESPSFALSIELKGGTGFYSEDDDVRGHSTSIGVGLTWF